MNLADFHFAEPRWLWLAVLAPVLLAWLHRHAAKARGEQLARMASPHFVPVLTASHSPGRRSLKELLLVVAVLSAGLALARPQWGHTQTEHAFVGEDVVFVVDCSLSMTTTDVLPSRLQRAKFAILDFVQQRSHGRVGLVTFAGSAFILCPLTFDTEAFEETLMNIDEKTMPIPGTDIGRALDEADRAMDKHARRKMVVLVTDGEDLEKSGIAVAKTLADKGIVVHAIGVGTAAGSPIRIMNDRGGVDYVRESDGTVVFSHLDATTLGAIAEATHGTYEPLGSLGEGLTRVRHLVEKSTNSADFSKTRKLGVDRYYIPVAALIILLVVESLIGTRRALRQNAS